MLKAANTSFKGFYEFIPLIVLWSASKPVGMMISLLVCLLVFINNMIAKKSSRMTNASLVFIMGINILYYKFGVTGAFEKRTAISYLLLSLMCFVSIVQNRPLTMDLSSDSYSQVSKTPFFIEMNKIITSVFGTCYIINMIASFAGFSYEALVSTLSISVAIIASVVLPSFMPAN